MHTPCDAKVKPVYFVSFPDAVRHLCRYVGPLSVLAVRTHFKPAYRFRLECDNHLSNCP